MKCEKCSKTYPCLYGYYIAGPTGPTGPQGLPAATISVNSTKTGKPNTDAIVTNSGTANNVLLDFVIPAGATGPSPTFEIGKVTTGAPGTDASVKIKRID